MSVDATQLSAIRRLLAEGDPNSTDQAVALMVSLGPEYTALFAAGLSVGHESTGFYGCGQFRVAHDSDVGRRVPESHRAYAALRILHAAGRLAEEGYLTLTPEELPFCTGLGGLRSLHIAASPAGATGSPDDACLLERLEVTHVSLHGLNASQAWILSSVARMPTLETLALSSCAFDDIDVLRTAPRLRKLAIENAAQRHGPWSLAALASVTTLRSLDMSGSAIAYDSIGALVHLEELRCPDAPDLSWMSSLVALRSFHRAGLQVNPADSALTLHGLGPSDAPLLEVVARMPLLTALTLRGCTLPSLAALAASPRLEQVDIHDVYLHRGGNDVPSHRPSPAVTGARTRSNLGALDGLQGVRTLRRLRVELAADTPLDRASIGRLEQLTELTVWGPPGDLSWASGLRGLTELRWLSACQPGEAPGNARLGIAGLGACVALEAFEADGAVDGLEALGSSAGLRSVRVGAGSRGAAVLSRLPALRDARAMDCDLDLAGLRALLTLTDLARVEVSGAHLPRALDQVQGEVAGMRAYVSRLAACVLPAAQPVSGDEVKLAKRALVAAFKAAKEPADAVAAMRAVPVEVLRALGMDARVEEDGRLVGEACGAKVTHAADVLLAFADRAGLLDGVAVLDLADHPHLASLAPLARHRDTLFLVDVRGCRAFRDTGPVLKGEALAQTLARANPTTAVSVDGPLPESLVALLRADAAAVARGVEMAASMGVLERLLEGCSVACDHEGTLEQFTVGPAWRHPCPTCDGSGRRAGGSCKACSGAGTMMTDLAPQPAGLRATMAALPAGSAAAENVLAAVQGVALRTEDATSNAGWLRHARALERLRLPWSTALAHLDDLVRLPALWYLTVDDVTGDLSPLKRLPALQVLCIRGKPTPGAPPTYTATAPHGIPTTDTVSLAGLDGHASLMAVHVSATSVQYASALARVPNLRAFGSTCACGVSKLCAGVGERLPVVLGGGLLRDAIVLNPVIAWDRPAFFRQLRASLMAATGPTQAP